MAKPPKPLGALDVEVLPNWNYILVTAEDHRVLFEMETWADGTVKRRGEMPASLVTFNGTRYDLPICSAIRKGKSPAAIKALSDAIIVKGERPRNALRERGIPAWRPKHHIDVFSMTNYHASGLKLRAARIHYPRLQLMPVDADTVIDAHQATLLKAYCAEDTAATWHCYRDAEGFISDIANLPVKYPFEQPPQTSGEQIWKRRATQNEPRTVRPKVCHTDQYAKCDTLRRIWEKLDGFGATFGNSQSVTLHGLEAQIGDGGLHTNEKAVVADDVVLADASSYYARLIILCNLPHPTVPNFPKQIADLLAQRLASKTDKAESAENSGRTMAKLMLASASGKLNSPYSCLYDQNGYLSMTRSGQMLMLDLADRIIHAGCRVYSINTDGVVCDNNVNARLACNNWMNATGIPLEVKHCAKYRAKDVGSCCAADASGAVFKHIGAFYARSRATGPSGPIIADAALKAVLEHDTWAGAYDCIRATVDAATHPSDFAIVKQSKTVIEFDGKPIGKLARFAVCHGGLPLVTDGRRVANADSVELIPDYATFDVSAVDRSFYVDRAMALWVATHAKGPLL